MGKANPDPPGTEDKQGMFELSLEDTLAQKARGVQVNARPSSRSSSGYNPYDAEPARTSKEPRRKPTDLRKLSEWIRLQREVEDLKKQS
jgi:hypothetical protein